LHGRWLFIDLMPEREADSIEPIFKKLYIILRSWNVVLSCHCVAAWFTSTYVPEREGIRLNQTGFQAEQVSILSGVYNDDSRPARREQLQPIVVAQEGGGTFSIRFVLSYLWYYGEPWLVFHTI
jgi:hypothetical protein